MKRVYKELLGYATLGKNHYLKCCSFKAILKNHYSFNLKINLRKTITEYYRKNIVFIDYNFANFKFFSLFFLGLVPK
jgi:hypothetical protein